MSIANTNTVAKVAAVVAGLGLVAMSFAAAIPARAATTAELEAQIAALLAQIQTLQAQLGTSGGSSSTGGTTFTMDLTIGSTGAEVTALQNWLIAKGHSIPAGATGYFGTQTQAALAAFQAANGISPAAGYFGPITRAKVNSMAGGSTGGGSTDDDDDTTSGDLEGGAGSVDTYTIMSSLNNEEVGEDEEDVEVAGLEIEADDGSDLMFTAVRLVFDEGTAGSDFEDYATEVSVWFDGEEVGRVDADDFTDDNNWTKTVSLEDAVLAAGETGELTVAVTGIGNLDSSDATDTWTVDFRQVRFEDADGATISEDPSTGTVTFSFDTFASAAGVELKVSEGDDSPESQVVNVDDTDDTDGVELLRFTLEAEGADVEIKDLPVNFATSSGNTAANANQTLAEVAGTVYLEIDGEEFSENTSDATEGTAGATVTFDDIDYTISADTEVEVVVKADINDTEASVFTDGDQLKAQVTASNVASIDAEDETGEDLSDADKSGTALGDFQAFFDTGVMVTFVSADESVNVDDGADDDTGTFTIKYNVESFDGTVYVASSSQATDDSTIGGSTVLENLYFVEKDGSATTTLLADSTTFTTGDGAALTSSVGNIQLDDGESTDITLTVARTNNGGGPNNGLFRTLLVAIGWKATDTYGAYNIYNFDLDDYKTDVVNID